MKNKIFPYAIASSAAVPLFASAQASSQSVLDGILGNVGKTLQTIIGLLFIIATIVFLWGVVSFIAKSGDEAARTKSKGIILWGIIGLAVMAAAWGITTVMVDYFGIPSGPPSVRTYPTL